MASEQEAEDSAVVSSVAQKILEGFLSELEEKPGYQETAARLRKTVLGGTGFNEAALREALFENEPK